MKVCLAVGEGVNGKDGVGHEIRGYLVNKDLGIVEGELLLPLGAPCPLQAIIEIEVLLILPLSVHVLTCELGDQ